MKNEHTKMARPFLHLEKAVKENSKSLFTQECGLAVNEVGGEP